MRGRFRWLAIAAAAALLVAAPTASADVAVLPNDGALPWSDPNHQSPLEQLATQIAAHIAGRAVRVYCDGETDWDALGGQREFDPNGVAGFVDAPHYYYPQTRTFYDEADIMHLSPVMCSTLEAYGVAAAKPSKCATTVTTTTTVLEAVPYTVTVKMKVRKRVRAHGRWVTRIVTVPRQVTRTRQEPVPHTTTTPGPPAPCYGTAGAQPPTDYSVYRSSAYALWALAHESIHLADFHAGGSIDLPFEVRADCYGLQWVSHVAQQLGTTPDDGQSLAKYVYDVLYPTHEGLVYDGRAYWSADCHQDGPLDLSPGDGVWP